MASLEPRFSFPALILRKYERQNDVVQHVHPLRLDLESRFLFLHEVVCAMEISDLCLLLIGGDQLQSRGSAPSTGETGQGENELTFGKSSPSAPSAHLY